MIPKLHDRLLLTGIVLIALGVVISRSLASPESGFGLVLLAVGALVLVSGLYKKIKGEA